MPMPMASVLPLPWIAEQVAFLDGNDNAANREEGLASMLDKIGETL